MKHRLQFAAKKILRMALLLLGVSAVTFLLMSASPLDPLQTNVGQVALGTMSQEQVDAILEQDPEDRTGIGIRNVNDRLRIYFGAPYGLRITSELDVGTCVEIRMPKVKEGEYEAK